MPVGCVGFFRAEGPRQNNWVVVRCKRTKAQVTGHHNQGLKARANCAIRLANTTRIPGPF